MLKTNYKLTTKFTEHETSSASHAWWARIETDRSTVSDFGASEGEAIAKAFATYDDMRERNEGTTDERLDAEAVEAFDERTQVLADKLTTESTGVDGLVYEVRDDEGNLVGRLHLDDSESTYRAEVIVGELHAMLDGAHHRKAAALHELAREFLAVFDSMTHGGVVCVGRDGVSNPMYRYRDELDKPEHMRTVVRKPVELVER